MWKVLKCSVQGRGHIKENIPCQDKVNGFSLSDFSIIALADGAGSAKYSHYGAEHITNFICEELSKSFNKYFDEDDGVEVKRTIDEKIKYEIRCLANKKGEMHDYASTLLVAAVSEGRYILLHIGDGVIGYSKNNYLYVASEPDNGEFVNTTIFTTSQNSIKHMKIMKGYLRDIDSFVLMSDGSEVSLYDKRKKSISDVIMRIIKMMTYVPDNKLNLQLTEIYEKIIRNKTLDDCSIAIMSKCSDEYKGYLNLSVEEKAKLLELDLNKKNQKTRFERLDSITVYLRTPKSIKSIARLVHLKPKYTKRLLGDLIKYNFIENNNGVYKTVIIL